MKPLLRAETGQGETVTVVIPTCDRTTDLMRCLDGLFPQLPEDNSVAILVTDDSRDATGEQTIKDKYSRLNWMRGPRRGAGANRNAAARQICGKWIIFIDDDTVPQPGFLDAYLKAMNETDAAVLEGKTVSDAFDASTHEAPVNLNGGTLPSCNFAVKRETFLFLSGFRECFTHWMEDVDFARRIANAGMAMRFVPDAIVYHPSRRKPGLFSRAERWRARSLFERLWGRSRLEVLFWLPWHVFRLRAGKGIPSTARDLIRWSEALLEAGIAGTKNLSWLVKDHPTTEE